MSFSVENIEQYVEHGDIETLSLLLDDCSLDTIAEAKKKFLPAPNKMGTLLKAIKMKEKREEKAPQSEPQQILVQPEPQQLTKTQLWERDYYFDQFIHEWTGTIKNYDNNKYIADLLSVLRVQINQQGAPMIILKLRNTEWEPSYDQYTYQCTYKIKSSVIEVIFQEQQSLLRQYSQKHFPMTIEQDISNHRNSKNITFGVLDGITTYRDILTVNGIVMLPYAPGTTPPLDDSIINVFTGLAVKPLPVPDQSLIGTRQEHIVNYDLIDPILDHIHDVWCNYETNTFNQQEDSEYFYQYVMDWLALSIRFPSLLLPMLIIGGDPGAGKSIIGEWIGREIFGHKCFAFADGLQQYVSRFNGEFSKALLVVIHELSDHELKSMAESRDFFNKLKGLITDPYKVEEQKYKDRKTVQNMSKVLAFTNYSNPIPIDHKDRRCAFFWSDRQHIGNQDYFKKLASCLTPEAATHFVYYLMWVHQVQHNERTIWNIPFTSSRTECQTQGKHPVHDFVDQILGNEFRCLIRGKSVFFPDSISNVDGFYAVQSQLYELYQQWEQRYMGKTQIRLSAFNTQLKSLNLFEFKTYGKRNHALTGTKIWFLPRYKLQEKNPDVSLWFYEHPFDNCFAGTYVTDNKTQSSPFIINSRPETPSGDIPSALNMPETGIFPSTVCGFSN